jgi:hypothetical protein
LFDSDDDNVIPIITTIIPTATPITTPLFIISNWFRTL